MFGNYRYSTNAGTYLNERANDLEASKPETGKTYRINPLYDYEQEMLQPKEKLIYRHPALEQTPNEFVPLNRVQNVRTYLPPRNMYGSNWSRHGSGKTSYGRPSFEYKSNNRYANNRRPAPMSSLTEYEPVEAPINRDQVIQDLRAVETQWDSPAEEVLQETPEEQTLELEYGIEKSLADCPEGWEYDFDFKKCVIKPVKSYNYNYRTASVITTPAVPVDKPGARYYDYAAKTWKNCASGQYYNYVRKTCFERAQPAVKRWSFFG